MIEKIFDWITRGALKYKWVTIVLSVIIMVVGVIAFTDLNQELIPKIEFPQTIILGINPGMDSETLLNEVTIPLEEAISQIDGIVNIETMTSDGLSMSTALNEFGEDQEEIQNKIQEAIDSLTYPEGMETPQLLSFSLSDLPMASMSISAEGMTLDELKALVESEIVPELEKIPGVATVSISGGQELPSEVLIVEVLPEEPVVVEPDVVPTEEVVGTADDVVLLPETWIQAFAAQGYPITAAADLTPEMLSGILSAAPAMLADLTPEMLFAMQPEVLAVLPNEYYAGLAPETLSTLLEMANEAGHSVPLPQSWIEAFAAQGQTIATTDDLTSEMIVAILGYAPQMIEALTPEMLLVMPLDALSSIPQEFLLAQTEELQTQLYARVSGLPVDETPADPTSLPAAWKSAGEGQGIVLETVADVTPETIQGIASMAPQMLNLLTPDNLRLFSPEVLGWLPVDYITTLEPALQAELNELALPVGGLGALAMAVAVEPVAPGNPEDLPAQWQGAGDAQGISLNTVDDLTAEVFQGIAQFAPEMFDLLTTDNLLLMAPEVLAFLPEDYFNSLDSELRAELQAMIDSANVFVPTATITRVDGNHSLGMIIFQDKESNTVNVSHAVFERLDEFAEQYPELSFNIVFEQASFIEESISGVTREGGLGALFAVVVILIFLSGRIKGKYKLSWRSTLVTGVSIPLSVLMAFAMFKWLPTLFEPALIPLVEALKDVPVIGPLTVAFASLFPTGLTLNIMTLSGMTVAVGRVVDDSIVVLENIYRHIQRGDDQLTSVIKGTRDVSKAIFASTATTVVVFLPIGLMGGLVGSFFLPFGIAVTYALSASFLVAITIVPLLAFLFIRKEHLPEEKETSIQRAYTPVLKWTLNHKGTSLAIAGLLLIGSVYIIGSRPQAFLPNFGEVRVSATVDLPSEYTMADTDALVMEFEEVILGTEGLGAIQVEIGTGGGMEQYFFAGNINQSAASISAAVENSGDAMELTALLREEAVKVFGEDYVVVSSGSLTSQGFGGFALIASSEDFSDLEAFNDMAIAALNEVEGLANVTSNLGNTHTFMRVDGLPAIRFVGELETKDTLGVTVLAKEALLEIAPDQVTISEGFESKQQTEGFAETFSAIGISIIVVYFVMVLTFQSFIHPFTILFSLPLAILGAAFALWATNSILGLSSMIGMMMLVGIVVTNAIVLVDRVQKNIKDRGMETYDALIEAGQTRLRPIIMTAMAAILALVPLAIGLNEGAIIAAELAIVVIGGLTTSTLLTLLIVPVMFSIFDELSHFFDKKKTVKK